MTIYTNVQHFTNGRIPFHIAPYLLKPGTVIEPHSHEFVEFVYIREGTGTHIYNRCAYPISAGDAFMIDQRAEHAYNVGTSERLDVVNILFLPEWMSGELQSLSGFPFFIDFYYKEPFMRTATQFRSKLTLNGSSKVSFEHRLFDLASEYQHASDGWELLCKWKFAELLLEVSRYYKKLGEQLTKTDLDHQLTMNNICDFIRTHHANPLTLEQVCRMCGMSQTMFITKFKEHTGQTFIEFRNRCRVEASQSLLMRSSAKMLEIAGSVGFEDLSFFNKTFKKFTGISPSEYRKRNKSLIVGHQISN